jgi:hypothetical protein
MRRSLDRALAQFDAQLGRLCHQVDAVGHVAEQVSEMASRDQDLRSIAAPLRAPLEHQLR